MKAVGTKDIVRGNKRGLKPKDRKLATTTRKRKLTANQWQATPQQNQFMDYWLNTKSEHFGNAYSAAIASGYSPYYAVQIASPAINNKWIQEYKRKINLTEEHIRAGITNLALNTFDNEDSRSPADTRLKAFETLAKVHSLGGYGNGKNTVNVTVVQPILGGESVKRTKVPSEVIDP